MQKVLLPFDGSPSARRALDYLVTLQRRLGDLQVEVLNVQSEPKLYGNYVSASMLQQLNAGALDHARELTEKAAAVLAEAGITHACHQVVGDVAAEISKAISRLDCDSVVMGTRGMGGLGNLVMGSVATRVVHDVPVPVLLVK